MTALLYLGALVAALSCLMVLDRRLRLVFWADARRGAVVVGAGVLFFLAWDVLAIREGFYERGGSAAMTGILLAPHLPIEELVFVTFLSYLALVVHQLVGRAVRAKGPRERGGEAQ